MLLKNQVIKWGNGREKLQPGNTIGCIAAKNEQQWKKVRDIIRNTKTKTVHDNAWNEKIKYYGTLTVR